MLISAKFITDFTVRVFTKSRKFSKKFAAGMHKFVGIVRSCEVTRCKFLGLNNDIIIMYDLTCIYIKYHL